MKEYKYDVAFSFTLSDEKIALQLYSLLKDRVRCFIYTEEQKRLAGNDGEIEFNKVFFEEARIVVVLYNEKWGETSWSRIEETAIKNRGFDEGYDFVTFVPMDHSIPPKWLAKNRIWVGLERWGVESAASVIEARIQDSGGDIKHTSIARTVRDSQDEIKKHIDRESILNSPEGLAMAHEELASLKGILGSEVNKIKEATPEWNIKFRDNPNSPFNIVSYAFQLSFHWHQRITNSLTEAYLHVVLHDGYWGDNGQSDPLYDYKELGHQSVQYEINELDERGWADKDTRANFTSSSHLVEDWLRIMMEEIAKKRKEDRF